MMLSIRRVFSNGHDKPDAKCPVEEAVADLVREASELRDVIRARRKRKAANGEAG